MAETNFKTCPRCGKDYQYKWEKLGELKTEVCPRCMADEAEGETTVGKRLEDTGKDWLKELK